PAARRHAEGRPLVAEAAEGGPLDRYRLRVVRVDLDDPAEPEGLVRLLADVKAWVEPLPLALGGTGRHAVPGMHRVARVVRVEPGEVGKVLVEVLFAGQHRPPGGKAPGAVV